MKREEFILNALDALGTDIKALVEAENLRIFEQKEEMKKHQEIKKKAEQQGKAIPVMAIQHTPNRLRPELGFFISRLHAITSYLEDQSQKGIQL